MHQARRANPGAPRCTWERLASTCGESASVYRIRPGYPMSDRVLRGKGKPFPCNETAANLPGFFGHPRRTHPFPPPAGEGAAHKGGRRGRT